MRAATYLGVILFIPCIYGFDFENIVRHSETVSFARDAISQFQNGKLRAQNDECVRQLGLFLENLNNTDDGMWALKMIDATAKIPAGVLEQNLAWLGRFYECINTESLQSNVKGKYCLTTIKTDDKAPDVGDHLQSKRLKEADKFQLYTLPYVAVCVPDKCSDVDVLNAFKTLLPDIPLKTTCQTKESVDKPLDTGAILTICYFGIFIIVMALSTTYDLLKEDGKSHPLLTSFSIRTNGRKLFAVNKNPGEFSCLYGIKFMSMMWVIIGHGFLVTIETFTSNIVDVMKYATTTRAMFFLSAVYAVDTFFVMTGMLVVYGFMKASRQGRGFNIIIFYLHRYIRLTPAVIPVILVSIYLTKYLGVGPFGPALEKSLAEPCEKYWWSTLLYVQNYANGQDAKCVAVTWYLNVDWQLYLIAPIFLLFLPKLPLIGLGLMLAAAVASMIASYIITWNNNLIAILGDAHGSSERYGILYYYVTHTRAATWFIGGMLGYVLATIKLDKNLIYLKVPKWIINLIWAIVVVSIPICVFVGRDSIVGEVYHPYASAFYNTLVRPAWGLCVAWIIFACSIGYGGIINKILSLPIFQVTSRFTYSMYLLHLNVLLIIAMSQTEPPYYTLFNIFYTFWGALALSFGLSIFWVLAFESPTIALERYLLGLFSKPRPKEKTTHDSHPTEIGTA